MNELDKLRPEVAAAVRTMSGEAGGNRDDAYDVIEAELVRLAGENADLLASNRDCMDWYRQLEADYRAMRAKIAEAPLIVLTSRDHPAADPRLPEYEGKPVRLLLVDGESA